MGSFFFSSLKILDGRVEVVQAPAERDVHGHGGRVADRGGARVEVADHPLVLGLEQVLPGFRHGLPAERVLVHEEPEGAGVDREPVALRVLQPVRDLLPQRRLVGGHHPGVLGQDAEGHAEVGDVGDRVVFLGDQLGQGLAGVLVVVRDVDPQRFLDRLQLTRPVRPLGRTVVAGGGFSGGAHRGNAERHKTHQNQDDLQAFFHGTS